MFMFVLSLLCIFFIIFLLFKLVILLVGEVNSAICVLGTNFMVFVNFYGSVGLWLMGIILEFIYCTPEKVGVGSVIQILVSELMPELDFMFGYCCIYYVVLLGECSIIMVSNALLVYNVIAIVRSDGLLWLNPVVIISFNLYNAVEM